MVELCEKLQYLLCAIKQEKMVCRDSFKREGFVIYFFIYLFLLEKGNSMPYYLK